MLSSRDRSSAIEINLRDTGGNQECLKNCLR